MEEQFVPYELAIKLKELGFDEPCLGGFDDDKKWWHHPDSDVVIDVPIWQQAFQFILTKVNMDIDSHSHYTLGFDGEFLIDKNTWIDYEGYHIDESYVSGNVDSLKFLIELVEKQK